jgi:hypothetical protein
MRLQSLALGAQELRELLQTWVARGRSGGGVDGGGLHGSRC